MKKITLFMLTAIFAIMLAACGNETAEDQPVLDKNGDSTQTDETQAVEVHDHNHHPAEPHDNDLCAFCNMEVYTRDEKMGVFTAQAIDSNGETLYFDDSGCLLNYQRSTGETLETAWVRDYVTKEWIETEQSVPVKANIQTPMKYGYAFFEGDEEAMKFADENTDKNALQTSWDEIDKVSNERYLKKMQMKMNKNSKNMEKNEDNEGNSSH
ncbi:hypothetical protein J7I93_09725 [Bacillus sp. ISL-47]|uniref:hypothetical protein n=1 Tax=Bacillus sp. ISL-47 TaxID=2819130 RepID=UPI001BEBFC2B|nr:hypothetical protein [Bacillus sp. ISL-47]MBT2688460.1 hypothetical protein [Bacillus sp. ISL-47]MBT2709077.1 hypothetical protein [Pseudomonas sp. ISL-84]